MQRKRHLQILKNLNDARRNPGKRFYTPSVELLNKALHDLEHAAFENRKMLQRRSHKTQQIIRDFCGTS